MEIMDLLFEGVCREDAELAGLISERASVLAKFNVEVVVFYCINSDLGATNEL